MQKSKFGLALVLLLAFCYLIGCLMGESFNPVAWSMFIRIHIAFSFAGVIAVIAVLKFIWTLEE